ncbi:BTAD domain-containing putative transcriptional regulator [Lentzea sp. NPDC102401]|uniref:BTAD domain-containing putative transcriptional regulator n=1 Tax=Lentzea sp. NPDC102401 TaxID=3364128 RepID=UPI00381E4D3C
MPTTIGMRAGRDLALNLASTQGLGLAGIGATAAARALLLHLLTERQSGGKTCVLAPRQDLCLILESEDLENLPATIRVVASLDAALGEMEAALLTRTRHVVEAAEPQKTAAPLVLLASATQHADRRLQAVLDNGSALGLAGVLLGQWRPGATVLVRHDGTISATSPGTGSTLAGTRLYHLPATDTAELLAVLHSAGSPPSAAASKRSDSDGPHQASLASGHQNDVTSAGQRSAGEPTRLESASRNTPEAPSLAEPALSPQLSESRLNDVDVTSADVDGTDARLQMAAGVEHLDDRHSQPHQPPAYCDEVFTEPMLQVRVMGRVLLHLSDSAGHREVNGALTAKQRELLVYLALHPQGVRREVLNEAVWPDSQPPRPYNSFHNTLSMLRRSLSDATDGLISNAILNDDGRYHLDETLVSVDYWQLHRTLQKTRPDEASAQRRLYDAVELYSGDLAEDLLVTWIEPLREATRRDVLDALSTLIRAHGDSDQEMTLSLLERTRKLDPYNEGVYQDIIRTQARLGEYAAIPRTLALLATTLDEIDQQPCFDTLNLADFVQRRSGAQGRLPGNAAAS